MIGFSNTLHARLTRTQTLMHSDSYTSYAYQKPDNLPCEWLLPNQFYGQSVMGSNKLPSCRWWPNRFVRKPFHFGHLQCFVSPIRFPIRKTNNKNEAALN